VIYSAGHNVVAYNTEYREMNFYPGLEGSWGISSMAVSLRKRYLAVAERAERAIITVYDLNAPRKKRILVTSDC